MRTITELKGSFGVRSGQPQQNFAGIDAHTGESISNAVSGVESDLARVGRIGRDLPILGRGVFVQQRDQLLRRFGRPDPRLHDLFVGDLPTVEDGVVIEILPQRSALE